MAGRVARRINDKLYFVLDEVGDSSGTESENVADEKIMSSSKDEVLPTEKPETEKDTTSVLSSTENEHDLVGYDPNSAVSNTDGSKAESLNVKSTESGNCESEATSSADDRQLDTSNCTNTEPIQMDIDSGSDGEIEQEAENEEVEPIIKISFRDKRVEKTYKSSILKYLTQKIHSCTCVPSSKSSLEVEIYEMKKQEDGVLDFHLDTTPNCDFHRNRVPSYGKNHEVLLKESHSSEDSEKISESAFVNAPAPCFNCNGNHVLRDCPHKRNLKEINKNRIKFKSTNKVQKTSRYHLDENQKFGDLVPGELTKKLRNALDLHKDQQPLFIYRMRLLGYPPAWLEEARISHSGVAIYDINGIPVSEEDEEEGEIIPERGKDRFDISKIIEFPGFNVPLRNNMKEEGKLHSCPGLSEKQSKENMIKSLEPNAVQAYKKRSLTLQKYSTQERSAQKPEKRMLSPTIEEMEERKRQLLMELNDEDVNDLIDKATESSENTENDSSPGGEGSAKKDTENQIETPESKNVLTLDYGTPILKSFSPYSKLPSREQFSMNVSDVINFENLPNSTGKYESMSSLIHKIRDTVTRIQNE